MNQSPSTTTVPASSPLREAIRAAVESVRADTPMAQSFTNFVTINLVANAQLAAGGTAAMSFLPDDVIDIAAISGATYINVGTLLPFYKDALGEITKALHEKRHRWVLDPVAAGLGATRTRILDGMRDVPPAVVRANASEILTLESMWNPEHAGPADDGAHGPAWNPPTTWTPPPVPPNVWPCTCVPRTPRAWAPWRSRAKPIWSPTASARTACPAATL